MTWVIDMRVGRPVEGDSTQLAAGMPVESRISGILHKYIAEAASCCPADGRRGPGAVRERDRLLQCACSNNLPILSGKRISQIYQLIGI